MLPVIGALVLALRQLADPAARGLVLRCVLLAGAIFAAVIVLCAALLAGIGITGWAWVDTTLAVLGSAAVLVLAILAFPFIIAPALNLFADEIVAAVEARYYPELPPARGVGSGRALLAGLRLTLLALVLNLLLLPLYLLPGANLLLFLALNSYLLGREYFELVALRRMSVAEARARWAQERPRLWLAGVPIAALFIVPVLNLVAPIVAAAFMTHMLGRQRRRQAIAGQHA